MNKLKNNNNSLLDLFKKEFRCRQYCSHNHYKSGLHKIFIFNNGFNQADIDTLLLNEYITKVTDETYCLSKKIVWKFMSFTSDTNKEKNIICDKCECICYQ